MSTCFQAWSGATGALTAPLGGITVSAQKTILQVQIGSTGAGTGRVYRWGYKMLGAPSAYATMELIETGTVGGTGGTTATIIGCNTLSATSNSSAAYSPTAEGTITATRLLDWNPDQSLFYTTEFSLGREFDIANGHYVRLRVTPSSGSVVVAGFIAWEE